MAKLVMNGVMVVRVVENAVVMLETVLVVLGSRIDLPLAGVGVLCFLSLFPHQAEHMLGRMTCKLKSITMATKTLQANSSTWNGKK